MESEVYIALAILAFGSIVFGQVWEEPFFKESPKKEVTLDTSGENIEITMLEEIKGDIIIAYLTYTGEDEPMLNFLDIGGSNDVLCLEFQKRISNWAMVVTCTQDYEGTNIPPRKRFIFNIEIGDLIKTVFLNIKNINDNAPILQALNPFCIIPENSLQNSDCKYSIEDADGWVPSMVWDLNDNLAEVFEFVIIEEPTNYLCNYLLKPKIELDFEITALYILNWTVTDNGDPERADDLIQESSLRFVVQVKDLPDTEPMWESIFASDQFLEKTDMKYTVKAVDGDIDINSAIFYKLDTIWTQYITMEDNLNGVINVKGIDRDAEQNEIYRLTVTACEIEEVDSCISQNITFIVDDINDNYPVITATETKFSIPENLISTLDTCITVSDIDLGDHAMYTIELQSASGKEYESAFSVAPTLGYQNTTIFLFITNSTLLDYEDVNWRSFEFEMVTIESANISHMDSKKIIINLENRNDEMPIFTKQEYVTYVNETIGINEFIEQVMAEDRDVNDTVIHSLLGTAINNILEIDEENGFITTKVENAFDFETQEEVIVQVRAIDTLDGVGNMAIAQLTVNVLDINDETPRIVVSSARFEMKENRQDGDVIITKESEDIVATDEDGTADLKFSINWTNSYAIKNGRRIEDEQFKPYINCLLAETHPITGTGHVAMQLIINEVVKGNTPDYELFDTLFIDVKVTDTKQLIPPDSVSVWIPLYIVDENDNAPEFDYSSIESIRSVTEHSPPDTSISIIIVTDVDTDIANITLRLDPRDNTLPDLVGITNRGELYVKGDIDADIPLYSLSYTVIACDGFHETLANITINITDTNDKTPYFLEEILPSSIEEKSKNGTYVCTITAKDDDRDEPFNSIVYAWNIENSNNQIHRFFDIDSRTGQVIVNLRGEPLDRDHAIPAVIIDAGVRVTDNDGQGNSARTNDTRFTIRLLDINDQPPLIQTSRIETDESSKKGEEIGKIEATDDDENGTDNTKIDFKILKVTKEPDAIKDPPIDPPMFAIKTDADFTTGIGQLITNYDLDGYFGTYKITVFTTDFGVPRLNDTKDVNIVIDKYNFRDPTIIFPENGKIIYLSKTQSVGQQLVLYNTERLDDFNATDNQNEKWVIIFDVESDSNIFTISDRGGNTGRLLLAKPQNNDITHELTITATDNGVPEKRSTSVKIIVKFIDENMEPTFNIPEYEMAFEENRTGQNHNFPPAIFDSSLDELNLPVYYFIREETAFTIPNYAVPTLYLPNILDREEKKLHVINVVATQKTAGNNAPEPHSIITLNIEITDMNDNPPNFIEKNYYGIIMQTNEIGFVIMKIEAIDLDDTDILTYSMVQGSLEVTGSNIANIGDPIRVKANGEVNLQFRVQSHMEGYFAFTALVSDNDTVHTDTTSVHIYIVSDTHRVEFIFINTLAEVNEHEHEIPNILFEEFRYICSIQDIQPDTDSNGEPMANQTSVRVHFINSETNEPVDRQLIENKANDIRVYTRLQQAFAVFNLRLLSFVHDNEPEDNMEEILRGWLIGVTVILGTSCIILLVGFILKVRSLSTRINKLSTTNFGSQESQLNRKPAPTTNKHTVQGSNPIYNQETRMPEPDETSITSGDDEMLGVENNPQFDNQSSVNHKMNGHAKGNNNIIKY